MSYKFVLRVDEYLMEQIADEEIVFDTTGHLDAVKSIVMVGALFQRDYFDPGAADISELDLGYLFDFFKFCNKRGIPIASDVTVEVNNLHYGDDFLDSPSQADVVMFCYIFHALHTSDNPTKNTLQSSQSHVSGVWSKALLASGARFAVNFGESRYELPTDKLLNGYQIIDKLSARARCQMDVLQRHPA